MSTEKAVAQQEATLIMPSTEELGELENMETGGSLVAAYRKQEDWHALKDTPVRCMYLGLKEIPNEDGELIRCGIFIEPDRTVFLAAQMVLVQAVERLTTPFPLVITYGGKKKNKSGDGSTNIFEVRQLKASSDA